MRHQDRQPWSPAAWLAACLAIAACLAPAATAGEPAKTILGIGSYWRVYEMKADKVIPLALLKEADPKAAKDRVFGPDLNTDPPPDGWRKPDFDDAGWVRTPGGFWERHGALFCLRTRFTVTDPKAVTHLTLSARYAGGLAVYLNGVEVLRRHLPKGPLRPHTPADPYPRDAYVDAKGLLLPSGYHIGQRIGKGEKNLSARVAKRRRDIAPVSLSAAPLRKGTNVLAVELHRSAFRPVAEALYKNRRLARGQWPHIGLWELHLRAAGAATPNVARPDGVQVWNQDVHRVFGIREYGDPHEPLRPVRLVGARNGVYSGQVVVGSTRPIAGLVATATALRRTEGQDTIPASQVRIRYAGLTTMGIGDTHAGLSIPGYHAVPAFRPLLDRAPAVVKLATLPMDRRHRAPLGLPSTMKPAAVQPVWVTVRIPKDAPAGRYRGTLSIRAQRLPAIQVPIELEVIGWTLPDPRDFSTFIAVYQSPESVAFQYNVPMWSEKHWALLDKSFELMGYLGNRLLVIPLVNRTEYGNDESRVPWIRRTGGAFGYDFAVHDRLVKLAQKHCKLKVITYQVYRSNGWGPPPPTKPTFVTVLDPATKKTEAMKLPAYATAESKKLWQPFIDELRKRFDKGGPLEGVRPILGIGHDGGVNRAVVKHFAEMWPQARWQYGGHGRRSPGRSRSAYLGYVEYLYVAHTIPSPRQTRRYGWDLDHSQMFIVYSQRIRDAGQTPTVMRTLAERASLLGDMGAGKMCIDYWPVKGSTRVMVKSLYSRWPESSARQRSPHMAYMGQPGPDGALATFKTEMLREGLQEAEARVFIEKALRRERIQGKLAPACQALLDKRTDLCRIAHGNQRPVRSAYNAGWQERSAALYRLAAQVARELSAK